jgi:glycosyltransferase involved in cell wall biosynthesis
MALEAIESVMRQQYSKVEIILVDDGSTDNTIAEVASQFPATHIITRHDVGPGQARNAGVAASKGDILMFLDSDDIWLDNHVQQLVDVLNRGFQVAYGVAHTKNMIAGADFLIPENGTGIEGDCFDALLNWCFLVPSAMAIQRDTFMAIGGFNTLSFGEDWIFFLKLAAQFPFGFAGPESITLRRLHSGSLCFLSDKKKLLVIIRGIFTFLKNEPRATASHLHYFKRLHDWTVDNNAQWSTVQEWYLSMLQEKII